MLLNMKCVSDSIYNFCLKRSSFLKEMSRILSYMHLGLHVKYLLFISDFMNLLDRFLRITEIQNFLKCIQRGPSCSIQTNGQT